MRLWMAVALLLAAGAAHAQDAGPGVDRLERREASERQGKQGGGQPLFAANPSALVAAEIELKLLSQREGQWKSLLKAAAPNAELFVPERVLAAEWLRERAEPESAADWEPLEVWMSCDGSYGVVRGTWRQPDAAGRFMTLWQRQEDGSYKWLLGGGNRHPESHADTDMIAAHVADCSRNETAPTSAAAAGDGGRPVASDDKSLYWNTAQQAGRAWSFDLHSWSGTVYESVFSFEGPAPAAR